MPGSITVFAVGEALTENHKDTARCGNPVSDLAGVCFGSAANALHSKARTLRHRDVEATGHTGYDDSDASTEAFSIQGDGDQRLAGSALYDATFAFADGASTRSRAVVFEGHQGCRYLAPADRHHLKGFDLDALVSADLHGLLNISSEHKRAASSSYSFVTCFTEGTRITTPDGDVAIEDLRIGDRITTRDHGAQVLRWVGQTTRVAVGGFRPVRISAGALGPNLPAQDLVVSQQHRMLVSSNIARHLLGANEVLVPARDLLGLPGVDYDDQCLSVTYLHLLMDRHEIVFAEGAPAESLMTGPTAQLSMGPEAIRELRAMFPELMVSASLPARIIPNGPQVRTLLGKHADAAQPLLQSV